MNFIQTIGQVLFHYMGFFNLRMIFTKSRPYEAITNTRRQEEISFSVITQRRSSVILMNMWNDLKQMPWSQISLNIVTLHYESSRAQSVLSCQAFFIDENTLFMVKGSMENQFWASISLLLRQRNLPGNREDFAGPLTKIANDLARERSFNTRPAKIGYFTCSYNPHFIFTNALPPQLMNVIPSVMRGKCLLSKGVKVLVWS